MNYTQFPCISQFRFGGGVRCFGSATKNTDLEHYGICNSAVK